MCGEEEEKRNGRKKKLFVGKMEMEKGREETGNGCAKEVEGKDAGEIQKEEDVEEGEEVEEKKKKWKTGF